MKRIIQTLGHSGGEHNDGLNLRRWFVFFVGFMATLAVVTLVGLARDGAATEAGQPIWLLSLYLFYMALCCTFFPAPTAWLVLLMASPAYTGPMTAGVTVALVAGVGALGTMIANLNEYHIFSFLLRFGRVSAVRDTRLYVTAGRYFDISPFWLVTAASFLPIPVDVIRWLAITRRYRRDHFAWASFLGRGLRYALLAATAYYLQIGYVGIIVIQVGILAVMAAVRLIPRLVPARATSGSDG